jgi:hypothetical protein
MNRREIARAFIGGPGFARHRYVKAAVGELRDSVSSLLGWGLLRAQLFPELVVDVDEMVELPGERLFIRMTVCTTPRPDAAMWPAAVILTFDDDDHITRTWAVQDTGGWLETAGILTESELESRFEDASARLVPDRDEKGMADRMFDGGFFREDAGLSG